MPDSISKLTMGSDFPQVVANEVFSKVKGHSTVAKLADQIPVAFSGNKIFTFSMDGDIAIVGEGAQKPAGNLATAPVSIQPLKVIYQGRLTDEFKYAADEARLQYMQAWLDGAAKKFAKGLDIMAFQKKNPATGTVSSLITSSFADVTNSATAVAGKEDEALEAAIALLGDYDNTGYAFSKTMGASLGKIREMVTTLTSTEASSTVYNTTPTGAYMYPEFRFGGKPNAFNGLVADVNGTVPGLAIVGDWSTFKWGYAKNLGFEIIEFGDPDGQGDLKRTNEILLRAEAYVGFAILDKNAFAKVAAAS